MAEETDSLVVVGGGIAGCAAAWSAARCGLKVDLIEQASFLGGVAVVADHRTLCGFAPLDGDEPHLLEAAWAKPVLDKVCLGDPVRRGRVWLWPSSGAALDAGLRQLLQEVGVRVHRGRAAAIDLGHGNGSGARIQLEGVSTALQAHRCIDASGAVTLSDHLGFVRRAAQNMPAIRGVAKVHSRFTSQWKRHSRRSLLHRLYKSLPDALTGYAISVEVLDAECIQLGVDIPHGSTLTEARDLWQQFVRQCGFTVACLPHSLSRRDEGGIMGDVSLEELFAHQERGACWLSWPAEKHTDHGVVWEWPQTTCYGLPQRVLAAQRTNYWLIGKGMAVQPAAIAALRVTGSAWHIGCACGERVATQQREA